MPFWVYILKSESTGKLYTGQTSNLEARVTRHNSQDIDKTRYTKRHKGPWHLIYHEVYKTRADAMKREKFLKSGQGREWVKEKKQDEWGRYLQSLRKQHSRKIRLMEVLDSLDDKPVIKKRR